MRLFVAVNFDERVKDTLCDTIRGFKEQTKSGVFTRRENLHLTLVFIGETQNIKSAVSAMDKISHEPFEICLSGIGRFRRSGGDIYWAGIRESPMLFALQKSLHDNLAKNGFKLEDRKFSPHITLGRQVTPADIPPALDDFNEVLSHVRIPVGEIHLMKSERINGILTYSSIYTRRLGITGFQKPD